VVLLGAATVIAQAVLLREAMAAMGGSELAWGAVMAFWLVAMAGGARIGVRYGTRHQAAWMPPIVLVLAGTGTLLFRAAPALLGAAPGESLTTTSALWLWALAVMPSAAVGGFAFPILAEAIGRSGGGRAYALEAVGALVGGAVLTGVLIGRGTAAALVLCFSVVAGIPLWRRRRLFLAVVFFAAGATAWSGHWLAQWGWEWAGRPGELGGWHETRLQRLELSAGEPAALYADGRLVASYPDPYVTGPKTHLLMLLHPRPHRVLTVGGAADGSIEAMLQHPVERLTLVEEDPSLPALLREWYGASIAGALDDPRVRIGDTDPIRALGAASTFDLILLLDGSPTTMRRNRTRTTEFFTACRDHLAPDGVLAVRVPVADTYLGGAAGRLVGTLAATVGEAFEVVEVLPGDEITLVAGGPEASIEIDHEVLAQRLAARGLDGSSLPPEMIPMLVDLDRAAAVRRHLEAPAGSNTVDRPRAVILAAGLHEARHQPGLLRLALAADGRPPWPLAVALAVSMIILLAGAFSNRAPVVPTAAAVGFASMGWWLLLIAAWQASRGSVYSEVGALTAVFMAGLAGGSWSASRRPRPQRWLPLLLAGAAGLSAILAGGIALAFPLVLVPVLLASAGALTGAAFPGLTALASGGTRRGAGIAFAADEIGAAAAAMLVGIIAIPWAGLMTTALGVGALVLASIPAAVVHTRRKGSES
jgi:spermidine synthase